MIQEAELVFLGTGGSAGIPVVGCSCGVCLSDDSRNRRLRTSALLRVGNRSFLIDAGPDFRQQGLRESIDRLDGVLLTHAHYDHVGGLDELRLFSMRQGQGLPCLLSEATYGEIQRRFDYLFRLRKKEDPFVAEFEFQVVGEEEKQVCFEGVWLTPLHFLQGSMPVMGFRWKTLAYVSDLSGVTDRLVREVTGVETLIVSALRWSRSRVHLTVDEAVEFSRKVGAKMTYLVHMAHELDHGETEAKLPEGVKLAWDGQRVGLKVEYEQS